MDYIIPKVPIILGLELRVRRFGEGMNEDSVIIVQNLEIKCINK
jgi:hypothetical protein